VKAVVFGQDVGRMVMEKQMGASTHKLFYEKVIRVKADVAAVRNLFSDVSIDVRW
jgi:hypothetical protein